MSRSTGNPLAFRIAIGSSLVAFVAVCAVTPLLSALIGSELDLLSTFGSALLVAGLVGLATAKLTERLVSRRIRELGAFVRRRDPLARLPEIGNDEVVEAASAINRIFSDMSELRGDMLDQGRALAETQEALRLREELAIKNEALEAQLAEQALLFEVLRLSAHAAPVEKTLRELVELVGESLDLRELALFFRDADKPQEADPFVLRTAWGFEDEAAVVGLSAKLGEGIIGEALQSGRPIFVPDVKAERAYRAFEGQVEREGAFAVLPIHYRESLIGAVAFTQATPMRPDERRMSFLTALSTQIGLVVRHAVLLDALRDMSTHDELTGLGNRRLLLMRLERELERARRYRHPVSVLCVDIDHFKALNDRCGHPTGDEALRQLAKLMEEAVRKIDTVARVGGEEFVIVLPRADLLEAGAVAEKIRERVAATALPGGIGQPEGRLTVSVGVAELNRGESTPALLTRGDLALYAAKDDGRNRVSLYREAGPEPFDSAA